MSTNVLEREEIYIDDREIERLRTENVALKMALTVAQRERDEWRILAEQCGPLGGEIDDYVFTVEKL